MNEKQVKLLLQAVGERRITHDVALAYLAAGLTDEQLGTILKAHKPQPLPVPQVVVQRGNPLFGPGNLPYTLPTPTPFVQPLTPGRDPLSPPWIFT